MHQYNDIDYSELHKKIFGRLPSIQDWQMWERLSKSEKKKEFDMLLEMLNDQ